MSLTKIVILIYIIICRRENNKRFFKINVDDIIRCRVCFDKIRNN